MGSGTQPVSGGNGINPGHAPHCFAAPCPDQSPQGALRPPASETLGSAGQGPQLPLAVLTPSTGLGPRSVVTNLSALTDHRLATADLDGEAPA